ncbi:uncharacterized protein LOC136074719 [Hydra vulgaris]|uniref:Uncharacterized protein LOC136074719 n=1 Tax=Hydra vulgaris TaxID=6087 RepID=A0ABM4B2V2_HYDVU
MSINNTDKSKLKVAGFEVSDDTAIKKSLNVLLTSRHFRNSWYILWEGLYGKIPSSIDHMVSGVCLWDCRWKIEFYNRKKLSDPGAVRALSLSITRNEVFKFIKEGTKVKSITVPKGLSRYHKLYLNWLKESVQKIKVKHIFMHIPLDEYHFYIRELENHLNKSLPYIHKCLDYFGQEIMKEVRFILEQSKVKYTFLNPMSDFNVSCPIQSYRYAYNELTEKYPGEEFFALEDLREFKLLTGSKVTNGIFSILDHPNPYCDKRTDEHNSETFFL